MEEEDSSNREEMKEGVILLDRIYKPRHSSG